MACVSAVRGRVRKFDLADVVYYLLQSIWCIESGRTQNPTMWLQH
jgi:hypothetical protein